MLDALVIGAGPAGLAITAALCDAGLNAAGISPLAPDTLWTSTYGIWAEELAPLGLTGVLARRWSACAVYAGERRIDLQREYGLIDNAKLQAHLLARLARAATTWHTGRVAEATQLPDRTLVSTRSGAEYAARVVIDASGHAPVLVTRPRSPRLAYQTAYGIVGRFSAPPVSPGQMVLMDYRSGHLDADERREPPTFLYAMDLGESRFFVEETSLAHTPPAPLDALAQRLHKRLAWQGVRVEEVEHVERCVFPMNAPLPALDQPVLGFGGAASMVNPISGYQVGAALRFAPVVARALATALDDGAHSPENLARTGWQALWPRQRLRRRALYLFGLANALRFDVRQTQDFFGAFFDLSRPQWSGYLSDTLSTPELLQAMLNLYRLAPAHVRGALTTSVFFAGEDLLRAARQEFIS